MLNLSEAAHENIQETVFLFFFFLTAKENVGNVFAHIPEAVCDISKTIQKPVSPSETYMRHGRKITSMSRGTRWGWGHTGVSAAPRPPILLPVCPHHMRAWVPWTPVGDAGEGTRVHLTSAMSAQVTGRNVFVRPRCRTYLANSPNESSLSPGQTADQDAHTN